MSSPQLKSDKNYKIEEFIDSGNFGGVFKTSMHEDQKFYALKQVNLVKHAEKDRPAALSDARNEYQLLKKGIPNVLRSFGSYHDTNKQVFRFSTEFMEMNLAQLIERNGPLPVKRFISIFHDILSGIYNIFFLFFPKKL